MLLVYAAAVLLSYFSTIKFLNGKRVMAKKLLIVKYLLYLVHRITAKCEYKQTQEKRRKCALK